MSPPTDAKDHHAALVRVEGRVAVLEDKVSGMSDKLTAIASTSAMTADYLRDMRDDHRADRAADIEEYRSICGVIRGLNLAENVINDLVQKMEKSDD